MLITDDGTLVFDHLVKMVKATKIELRKLDKRNTCSISVFSNDVDFSMETHIRSFRDREYHLRIEFSRKGCSGRIDLSCSIFNLHSYFKNFNQFKPNLKELLERVS